MDNIIEELASKVIDFPFSTLLPFDTAIFGTAT